MELRSSPSAESFVSHSSQHPTPSGVKKKKWQPETVCQSCHLLFGLFKKKHDNGITISKFSSFTSTSWRLSPPCFSVFLSPWKMASNDSQEIFLSSELWKKKHNNKKDTFNFTQWSSRKQDRQQDANWNSSHVFPSFLLLLSSFFNSQTCWWNCEVLGCLRKWVLSLRTFEVYVTLEVVGWKCTDAR